MGGNLATIVDVARQAAFRFRPFRMSSTAHARSPRHARAVRRPSTRRLQPEHCRPRAEDSLDPIGRRRDFGDLEPLFQRHHLRDRERMRAARHDGVPVRHRGRSGARTRGGHGAASAARRRDHPRAQRRSRAARARLFARRAACPACWSTACPIRISIRSASTIARRCGARRARRRPRPPAHRLYRRQSRLRDHAGAHRRLPRRHAPARPRRRRALSRHRQRDDRNAPPPRRARCSISPAGRPRSSPATIWRPSA